MLYIEREIKRIYTSK